MGVTEGTYYRWRKTYGGMGVTEIRRLKQLEEENAKLKRLVADLSLDKTMLQDALGPTSCCLGPSLNSVDRTGDRQTLPDGGRRTLSFEQARSAMVR